VFIANEVSAFLAARMETMRESMEIIYPRTARESRFSHAAFSGIPG